MNKVFNHVTLIGLLSLSLSSVAIAGGPYEGSEAEVFAKCRVERLKSGQYGQFMDSVQYKDKTVDIQRCPEKHLLHGFKIKDKDLADIAGVAVNTILSREQLENNRASDRLIDAITERELIEVGEFDPNPYWFDARPVSLEDLTRIEHLRSLVRENIQELNRTTASDTKLYMNPNAGLVVSVNSDCSDGEIFSNVLKSIESDDDDAFVKHAVEFATLYNEANLDKRAGFIDVFTHLFVTKEFPTEGMREYFSHMTLRCGVLTGFSRN